MKISILLILFTLILIFIIVGALLNIIAVKVNGGKMPVYINKKYVLPQDTKTHIHYNRITKANLWFLTDIFFFRVKKGFLSVSIGDIFIFLGMFLWLITFILTSLND